jgi:release factor glutamine methyltransferase
MTYREALSHAVHVLTEAGIEDAAANAWYLMAVSCRIDRNFYYMHQEEAVPDEEMQAFEILLSKREERIPLEYIVGEQEFMGLSFKVNSNVLIPRQDTEVLVEKAIGLLSPDMDVLDMCTGSGCIVISLMKHVEGLHAMAVDVSKAAILTAKENAVRHQVDIDWIVSDMFDAVKGSFDLIVSNPPYIPTAQIAQLMPEVRDFEPIGALDGSEDGLKFYRILAEQCPHYLKKGGRVLFEIGCEQGQDVSGLLREQGFSEIEVGKDLAGFDRIVSAVWNDREQE